MMRLRFADEYPATVATTLRMVDGNGVRGSKSTCGPKIAPRCRGLFLVRAPCNRGCLEGKQS
jgi:hypothetical protein